MSGDAPVAASAAPIQQAPTPETTEEAIEQVGADQVQDHSVAQGTPEAKEATKGEVKDAAQKTGAKQSKADPEKYTLKVDGETMTVSKDELIKLAQMGKGAQKRFQESAQVKKDFADFIQALKEDPMSVLGDDRLLGDAKLFELAKAMMNQKLEEESKSPEQREKEKMQKELEDLRKQLKDEEEGRKQSEYEKMVASEEAKIETEVTQAFEELKLPRRPAYMKRMVDILITAEEAGKKVSPLQALKIAKKELVGDVRELFDLSPDEMVEELLGKDRIKSFRKKDIDQAKAAVKALPDTKVTQVTKTENKAKKPVSIKDWLKS